MTAFYLKSGAGAADYQQTHTYSLGDKMVPARGDAGSNFAVARKCVWECTTAGLTVGTNPTWPASVTYDTTTVSDGTATFTARKPGYSSGSTANWAWAGIYWDYVCTALAAGDTMYVSNNHAETHAAVVNGAFAGTSTNPCYVYCVNDSAAPPTANATGGSVSVTGANLFTVINTGCAYVYGMTFSGGSGSSAINLELSNQAQCTQVFDTCAFVLNTTAAGQWIIVVNIPSAAVYCESCTFSFGAASQFIFIGGSTAVTLDRCSLASGTAALSAVFQPRSDQIVRVNGFDFSHAATSCGLINSDFDNMHLFFMLCKPPASWSGAVYPSAARLTGASAEVIADLVDASGTNYKHTEIRPSGLLTQQTTIVKTSGATDGTTPLSWVIDTSGSSWLANPFKSEWRAVWNDSTSSKTLSWDYIADANISAGQGSGASFAFQNNEVWVEVLYLSDSGDTLGTLISSAPATPLTTPTDNSAGSASWTTTGMTTPKIGVCSVTFTPGMKGVVLARICVAPNLKAIYADPMPALV